ncbi:TPA: GNAT family N-acetyltransferase [Photobacterium damselae]
MFTVRQAIDSDYDFLFDLKKAAEYGPINAVFGWDEELQRKMHRDEWNEDKPVVIEINGIRAGSYLVQLHSDHVYFGRFFLLPEFQGNGIGSKVLNELTDFADENKLAIKLCYLQGNRVGALYDRFDFDVVSQDAQYVNMIRYSK